MTKSQKIKYYEQILENNGLEEYLLIDDLPNIDDVKPKIIDLKIGD